MLWHRIFYKKTFFAYVDNKTERRIDGVIIGSKASIVESQLKDRQGKGSKFIELSPTLADFKDLEKTLDQKHLLRQCGLIVYAVHAPLLNSHQKRCVLGETNVLMRKDNLNLIKKSVILADKFADLSNPLVVVSAGNLIKEDEFNPDLSRIKKDLFQKDLWELSDYITKHYPRVSIAVKNNPKVKRTKEGLFYFDMGYEEDFFMWIREMRGVHMGVALDVANAIDTIRYNKQYNPHSYFSSIQEYLYRYSPLLKVIHLANSEPSNETEGFYHLPFLSEKPKDMGMLRTVLSSINEIKYVNPITIATDEERMDNAENFLKTREAIIHSFKR